MGPVLHGRLAPRARRHLGHRSRHLRDQHPDGIHGLSVAAELRLAVHRRQCQGRDEWGRRRRLLQRSEFRSDVRPAHHAAADRSYVPGRRPHRHGPRPRRRQTDRSRRRDAVMKSMGATQEEYYRGVRMVPYDLVKELVLALAGVGILAIAVSAILSSPDVPPTTIAAWAQADPVDFVTTATGELAGSTTSAGYGNPYNTNGSGQAWGPIAPQTWFGTRIPLDSAATFVIEPLQRGTSSNTELGTALDTWQKADSDQQGKWTDAYTKALPNATVKDGKVSVPDGEERKSGVW